MKATILVDTPTPLSSLSKVYPTFPPTSARALSRALAKKWLALRRVDEEWDTLPSYIPQRMSIDEWDIPPIVFGEPLYYVKTW